MKKTLRGLLIVLLLTISFTATVFAFPATGKYGDGDGGTLTIEINESGKQYFGKIRIPSKGGAFIAEWAMALSKGKNSNGYYEIDCLVETGAARAKTDRLIEPLSADSFKMFSLDPRTGKMYSWGIWNKID